MKIYWIPKGERREFVWTSFRSVRIFVYCLLLWTSRTITTHVHREFILLPLMARSFMWIYPSTALSRTFSLQAFPTQWSFGSHCVFLSSTQNGIVLCKYPQWFTEWYIFKREMDIKGDFRSGSIAPHLLDLFNKVSVGAKSPVRDFLFAHQDSGA